MKRNLLVSNLEIFRLYLQRFQKCIIIFNVILKSYIFLGSVIHSFFLETFRAKKNVFKMMGNT